jgi:hypothetical protein
MVEEEEERRNVVRVQPMRPVQPVMVRLQDEDGGRYWCCCRFRGNPCCCAFWWVITETIVAQLHSNISLLKSEGQNCRLQWRYHLNYQSCSFRNQTYPTRFDTQYCHIVRDYHELLTVPLMTGYIHTCFLCVQILWMSVREKGARPEWMTQRKWRRPTRRNVASSPTARTVTRVPMRTPPPHARKSQNHSI